MILITSWHPGDVRHMPATELKPCFKYISARLKPELQSAMRYTPLISSLCQLLLKPICHKERDKIKRRERREEGERVSMQNRGGGQYRQRKANVETKTFLKLLFWGGASVMGDVGCRRGWGRGVGFYRLGDQVLNVEDRDVRSSGMVWGALQKWLMMNLGYSGPQGLCHPTHLASPHLFPNRSASHPTFLPVCNCLGMCSSRIQLCVPTVSWRD